MSVSHGLNKPPWGARRRAVASITFLLPQDFATPAGGINLQMVSFGDSLSNVETDGPIAGAVGAPLVPSSKPKVEPRLRPVPREDNRIIPQVKAGQIPAYANLRLLAIGTATADSGMRHIFSIGLSRRRVDAETSQFCLHLLLHLSRPEDALQWHGP
jgi:hypothetical protein